MDLSNEREKVIKGLGETLRYCHEIYNGCNNDGQYKLAYINQAAKDAIALLKAQEPHKKGYWIHPLSIDCICSECGNQPEHEPGGSVPLYDYCPYCGAEMEVKWDD